MSEVSDFIIVIFILMPLTLWLGYHCISWLTFVSPLYGRSRCGEMTYREWLKEDKCSMNWFKRHQKRFGLWLCSKNRHKSERYIGFDFAYQNAETGIMCISKVCKRCNLIILERYETCGRMDINITNEPVTKLKLKYRCTVCNEESRQCLINCNHKLRDSEEPPLTDCKTCDGYGGIPTHGGYGCEQCPDCDGKRWVEIV